jgi:hypothetical protein
MCACAGLTLSSTSMAELARVTYDSPNFITPSLLFDRRVRSLRERGARLLRKYAWLDNGAARSCLPELRQAAIAEDLQRRSGKLRFDTAIKRGSDLTIDEAITLAIDVLDDRSGRDLVPT